MENFEAVIASWQREADDYYQQLAPHLCARRRQLLHSAVGGLLWTKQFYYQDVFKWLFGEPNEHQPTRQVKSNRDWQHLTSRNIISIPDKWE